MGGYYPALAIRPPENLADQLTRAVQLRSLIGAQQMQQQQIEMQQRQLNDQQAFRNAFMKNNGDVLNPNFVNDVAQAGGSPDAIMNAQTHAAQLHNFLLTGQKEHMEVVSKQNDILAGHQGWHRRRVADEVLATG